MTSLNQAAPSVKVSKYLYDVITVDTFGESHDLIGESLPIESAVARMAGYNANSKRLTAVAVATVFTKITEQEVAAKQPEAASVAADASPTTDESEAKPRQARLAFDVVGIHGAGLEAPRLLQEAGSLEGAVSFAHAYNEGAADYVVACVVPHGYVPDATSDSDAFSEVDDSDVEGGIENAADGESRIDFSEEAEEESPKRGFRVTVMRGSGDIDILPGAFTEEEAAIEAQRYRDIEGVYVAEQLDGLGSMAGTHPDNIRKSRPTTRYDLDDVGQRFRGEGIRNAFRHHWQRVSECIDLIEDASDVGHIAKSLQTLCDVMGHEDNFLAGEMGEQENWRMIEALGFEGEPASV